MPTFEIVCLENSRRGKGRCVAGLRTDGQGWIRPVGSNAEGILHPYHYTLHNNTEAQTLDVLRVDCSRAHPKPHHPEDWIAQPVSWRLISRPVNPEQMEWLRSHLTSGPHLLGCTQDKIAHRVLQARPAAHSLALIAPQKLQWLVKIGADGERKVRALFGLDGAEYNLALTDPVIEGRLQHLPVGAHPRASARLKAEDDVWLTISLSEPFAPDGGDEEHCYKLVAAVIVVPHTGKVMGMAGAGSPNAKASALNVKASNAGGAQATQAAASAANAFPANHVGEKSLRVKRALPDLSAYPDPFAETEPGQAAPIPSEQNLKDTKPPVEQTPRPMTVTHQFLPTVPVAVQPVAPPDPRTLQKTSQNDKAPLPQTPFEVNSEASSETISEAISEAALGVKTSEDTAAKPPTRFDKMRQKVPRAYMSWTREEDATLLEQMQAGGSIKSIAAQMQRHEGAIRSRLKKFGLIEAEEGAGASLSAPEPQVSQTPPTKPDVETPAPSPADSAAIIESTAPTESIAVTPVGQYSMSEPKARTLAKEQKASPEPRPKTETANIIRVIVCGAAGRMGREVVKAVVEADGLHLVAAVDVSAIGSDAGELAGVGKIGVVIESQLEPTLERWTPDVLIDFTLPDSVKRNAIVALEHGVSPVIGTTGLGASDLSTLDALAKDRGIGAFIAPNFAIGAVLAMQFAAQAARYLPDVEIIELHHEKKLDSPSGTALLTAQKIAAARHEAGVSPLPTPANTIEKAPGARGARHVNTGDIPVHSVRLPGFVAHQEVIFGGQGEILTIRHDSIHRSSFMPGVVLAVRKVRALDGLVIGLENLLS